MTSKLSNRLRLPSGNGFVTFASRTAPPIGHTGKRSTSK